MKFFQKRSFVVILCWTLIIVSTLLNIRIRFGAKCREVSDLFYAENEISMQLEQICSDAMTLSSVAAAYGIDAASLRSTVESMQDALNQNLDPSYISIIYEALSSELSDTEQKLLGAALNENHAASVSTCLERIHVAQHSIESSSYNNTVYTFQHRYDRFPTNVFAKLVGVEMPEVFA